MEAASVRAEPLERAEPQVKAKKAPKPQGTPWWMWVAVAAIVLFCLFPFYWMLNISLKSGPDLSSADLIPPHPTLNNYESIFRDSNFTNGLRNSAIVAIVTTFLALVVGSFAAYALARL